jgi:hypothetical protein
MYDFLHINKDIRDTIKTYIKSKQGDHVWESSDG